MSSCSSCVRPSQGMSQPPSTQTFYRSSLPSDEIAFQSKEGRELFVESLSLGFMEGYFPLASQFHTQSDPAFCGLGSLTMVLNALSVDPQRTWKGIWRWYSEELLNCCAPLDEIKKRGLYFHEFTCLARCNGAIVQSFRASESTVEQFREFVKKALSAPEGQAIVVNYDRQALKQVGTGHYSPIGGYHPGLDYVLILDVARFKYPPHWVSLPQLFQAMQSPDPDTGKSRGFFHLASGGSVSSFCRINVDVNQWKNVIALFCKKFCQLLKEHSAELNQNRTSVTLRSIIQIFLKLLQQSVENSDNCCLPFSDSKVVMDFFTTYQEATSMIPKTNEVSTNYQQFLDQLFAEIHQLELFKELESFVNSTPQPKANINKELLTVLLLALPDMSWENALPHHPEFLQQFKAIKNSIPKDSNLGKEVEAVSYAFTQLNCICSDIVASNVRPVLSI